ncbi:transmembrane immune signaling adaptor TYROBP S homeolog isoform X1 [Xenopus laevis]|uniref:TYRO protein tyrosine kinase-binding protein n=1 Tax=Xenopus laevis TaxID=8355 RepID=A0A8J0TAL0_XENLA|nr:transmembrane immune signaling adaptor TYROBP S homeolog isoform X1 [Xenopus laevis]
MNCQSPTFLILVLATLDCGSCFHLDTGAVIGIIICDVVITVIIALIAYYVSNKIQMKKEEERKRNSQKPDPQEAEPAYEELRDHRMDIYNDLSRSAN